MRLIHTNDFHGTLTADHAARLLEYKADGLFFDCGDVIRTGNLGIPTRPEAAWPLLAAAGCDASVIGNRETHVLEAAFRAKLAGARHPVLCGNMVERLSRKPVLPSHLLFQQGGMKVGVLAVSVAMVTERMVTKIVSHYLWGAPIPAAVALARDLRPQVDLLIALTHVGHSQDRKLAEACAEIDIILGGHSHTVLMEPEHHHGVWIAQGGSHARFVGVYDWDGTALRGGLQPLKQV